MTDPRQIQAHAGGTDADGYLRLAKETKLPDLLDVLIVGGGPAGTAAAFRAKELGRSALVIDMDDILSRIRDYAKDKPILPNYGRGDRMKFPLGGELFNQLHFEPIDKDTMHENWKSLYYKHSVPAQIGVELVGLEVDQQGIWSAKVKNRNTQNEELKRAKQVILALGRGVPRRFDIPGNLDYLAFRFTDPAGFVGGPACVVGGGTSAAEAVIAISNAKVQAGDETGVYWLYRGTKLPKVSAALAEPFFEAYVGNGNVFYHRRSEPAAVLLNDDKREVLSVRVDRRGVENRPAETLHYEFDVERCVACIGEDVPVGLLSSMGIHMRVGGRRKSKRLAVSPLLETQFPNLYLIGDTLSDSYMETTNFLADPKEFADRSRPGNIKMALRDGLVAMESAHQRLNGQANAQIEVRWAKAKEEDQTEAPFVAASLSAPPSPQASGEAQPAVATLVRLLPGGVEEEETPLPPGRVLTIGKGDASLAFPDDSRVADLHATVAHHGERFTLTDGGSPNGVFLQLAPGTERLAPHGTIIRTGKQFLRVQSDQDTAVLEHFDAVGTRRGSHPVTNDLQFFGRKDADTILDADDHTLSRRHLSAVFREGKVLVTDHFSANGSWLKVEGEIELADNDVFRVGHQTLRFSSGQDPQTLDMASESAGADKSVLVAVLPAETSASSLEPTMVTISGSGSLEADPGMTLLEVAEDNEIPIECECRGGTCGFDPVRVISGGEHLEPKGDLEAKYLGEKGYGEDCRFACMAVLCGGPVEIEILNRK